MYCMQCGVKLSDTEKACPLCGTVCYHPDIPRPQAEPLYPHDRQPQPQVSPSGVMSALTILFLIPVLITLLCDLRINRAITWSGYAAGAIALAYEIFLLPGWFRRPNPVIFVPCCFAAVGLYLLYIDLHTGGSWFLSFAFPLVGGLCIIFTTLITLLRYVKRGRLYIFGGCAMALGAFMPLIEFLAVLTFHSPMAVWSVYPFVALLLLGGYLIFLGICRPARESMERKFFI